TFLCVQPAAPASPGSACVYAGEHAQACPHLCTCLAEVVALYPACGQLVCTIDRGTSTLETVSNGNMLAESMLTYPGIALSMPLLRTFPGWRVRQLENGVKRPARARCGGGGPDEDEQTGNGHRRHCIHRSGCNYRTACCSVACSRRAGRPISGDGPGKQ